jgi:hypothetical protein
MKEPTDSTTYCEILTNVESPSDFDKLPTESAARTADDRRIRTIDKVGRDMAHPDAPFGRSGPVRLSKSGIQPEKIIGGLDWKSKTRQKA